MRVTPFRRMGAVMLIVDVRDALRRVAYNGRATVLVVLILAVPIGVTTAVYSMVEAIALRPFLWPQLDRIVTLSEVTALSPGERHEVAPANFIDLRDRLTRIELLSAYRPVRAMLRRSEREEPVQAYSVSEAFFSVIGVVPARGRVIGADDIARSATGIVISDRLWRRLGAPEDAVGRTLIMNGRAREIVGVMRGDFDYPALTDVWMPLVMTADEKRDRARETLGVIGRLSGGTSMAVAATEARAVMSQIVAGDAHAAADRSVAVVPLREAVNRTAREFLMVLAVAAGLSVLLACANVANLQLARGAARQTDMSIRIALGAPRYALVRGMLLDGLVVGTASALAAAPIAIGTLGLVKRYATEAVVSNVAGWTHVSLDARAGVFAAGAGLVAGLFVALPAIFQTSEVASFDRLKASGRSSSFGVSHRVRSALVLGEVAIAGAMLVACVVMVNTFERISHPRYGYEPEGLLTFRVVLSENGAPPQALARKADTQLAAAQGVAGVELAAAVNQLPSVGESTADGVSTTDAGRRQSFDRDVMEVRTVSVGYFETMRTQLLGGRVFVANDNLDGRPVAIVSRSAAERLWPGAGGVGRALRLDQEQEVARTVVGVVEDVNYFILDRAPRPTIYIPQSQRPSSALFIVVRGRHPEQIVGSVRAALAGADPAQSLTSATLMTAIIRNMAGGVAVVAALLSVLAALALIVALAGVYAVISYLVVVRRQEIAIRIALARIIHE